MCAIVGVFGAKKASTVAYYSLFAMQHRGQEATGISVSNGENIAIYKKRGMVADVFSQATLDSLEGSCAVGLVHNGNLINKQEVRQELLDKGAIFQTDMDTENIIHLIAKSQEDSLVDRIKDMLTKIEGAFCLAIQSRSKMFVIRDRFGIRPLSLGKFKDGGYMVASETCAFDLVGAEFVRDVEPGEMLTFEEGQEPKSEMVFDNVDFHPCAFEYIYFARPDSDIDGKNVYEMRLEMGKRLARETPCEVDLVLPVPDSGVAAAKGYADELGLPFEMGIVRNHYVGRTFIEPTQEIRDLKVKMKLSPVKHLIEGKRVAIIDDSLVRGTTSKQIVRMLLDAGAKEVHMRIAAPEIKYPCRYGIDTPTKAELISANYSVDEIRAKIGATSLGFLSIEGLTESLGNERNYSLVSFDGKYFAGGNEDTPGCAGGC
jgi:amidophosphoribosyltransferase